MFFRRNFLRRALAGSVAALAMSVSFVPAADASTVTCNGCSAQDMEFSAYAALELMPTPAYDVLYVVNRPAGTVRKFELSKSYDNGGDPRICEQPMDEVPLECVPFSYYNELAVEAPIVDFIQFMQAHSDPLQPLIDNHNQLPQNPYDDVTYPDRYRDPMDTFLNRIDAGTTQSIKTFFSVINPFSWFKPEAIRYYIEVRYPEGGTSRYVFNETTLRYERVKGETRDRHGNRVPESREGFVDGPGTVVEYEFPGDNEGLTDFINRMILLGVPIVDGPGPTDRLVCRGRVDGERVIVECEWQ